MILGTFLGSEVNSSPVWYLCYNRTAAGERTWCDGDMQHGGAGRAGEGCRPAATPAERTSAVQREARAVGRAHRRAAVHSPCGGQSFINPCGTCKCGCCAHGWPAAVCALTFCCAADPGWAAVHRLCGAGVELGVVVRPQGHAHRELQPHEQFRWHGLEPVLGMDQLLLLRLSRQCLGRLHGRDRADVRLY